MSCDEGIPGSPGLTVSVLPGPLPDDDSRKRGVDRFPPRRALRVGRCHQMAKIRVGVVALGVVRTESLQESA